MTIEPKACQVCPTVLSSQNRSGYCTRHVSAATARNPEWRAKQKAGAKRALQLNPERLAAVRAQLRVVANLPQAVAARRKHCIEARLWEQGNAANAARPAGSESRKRAGERQTATRLSWCPPHLRQFYRDLVRTSKLTAAEARTYIEAQNEIELARWRRSITPVCERPEEPTAAQIEISRYMPLAERAIALVCNATGFTPDELKGPCRDRPLVRGRWVIYNVLRAADRSMPTIARMMGRSDHNSVGHGLRETRKICRKEPDFAGLLDSVMAQCAPLIDAAKAMTRDEAA